MRSCVNPTSRLKGLQPVSETQSGTWFMLSSGFSSICSFELVDVRTDRGDRKGLFVSPLLVSLMARLELNFIKMIQCDRRAARLWCPAFPARLCARSDTAAFQDVRE